MEPIINLKKINGLVLNTVLFSIFFSFISCKKFIQIDAPKTRLVAESVFADNMSANAAMTTIYSQMENKDLVPYYISLYGGLSADELTSFSSYPDLGSIYQNSLTPANTLTQSLWSMGYNYIYQANAVLDGLQNSSTISPIVKQQLSGEAKFIRAFWHFYLLNFFGDIPLVTTTNYTINGKITRSGMPTVYQQIISDLKDAQGLLSKNFVDKTDSISTIDRVRPTYWAATALLARTYLYIGDNQNSESQASIVIDNASMFNLPSDLNQVFVKNSNEAIWQLMVPQPSNINTVEAQNYVLNGPPLDNVFNSTTLSNELLNSFEAGDYRKRDWIDSIVDGNNAYFFPFKYKIISGPPVIEYSMVLRLAEQYLIRGEARTQLGNTSGALADLNAIRNRAGLPDYSGPTDKASLLAAILHERQVELFSEWGHRWFDLKRTNQVDAVMSVVTPLKGGTWNSYKQLFPIPQIERNNDPNLAQNQGY